MLPIRTGLCALALVTLALPSPSAAQMGTPAWTPQNPGSENIEVLGHVPLGPCTATTASIPRRVSVEGESEVEG